MDLNEPLPESILPGVQNPNSNLGKVTDFLRAHLSASDGCRLQEDLKWTFLLAKHSLRCPKRKRIKKPYLTRKQRIEFGLLKLPKEGWNYESLAPMRKMWIEYMLENFETDRAPAITDPEWVNFSQIAAKSELIGAEITVVRSKVVNQIGLTGTVVLETKMTFQIVTPKSQLKIIIKENAVFEIRLKNIKFTVFGKHIATRPSERSAKKIKIQMTPDL